MKNNTAKYQFLFLILLLSAPVIFHVSPLKNHPLHGHSEKPKKPEVNLENWLSGKTQEKTDNYFAQEFGFHSSIVRFNNEWQYHLFNKANTKNVIVGKDEYLFTERYIDAYIGNDYIGEKGVNEKTIGLFKLNKELEAFDKKVIVVIAPGKGSFYPEYIPKRYLPKKKTNNHKALSEAFKKQGLNFIDFNELFVSMKDTSSYPLYPKTGIHWSEYGLTFMADSLIKYIEQLRQVDLPDLKINKLKITDGAEGTDMDIEKSMNLIWDIPNIPMAYPKVSYETKDKDSLKVLVVADSYYWQLFNKNMSSTAFNNSQFFYYNQTIHPRPKEGSNSVNDLDLKNFLNEYGVIVLMATEANLVKFPWDFDKHMLEALKEEADE